MTFCEDEHEFALQALIAMSCNPLFARPNLLVYVILFILNVNIHKYIFYCILLNILYYLFLTFIKSIITFYLFVLEILLA